MFRASLLVILTACLGFGICLDFPDTTETCTDMKPVSTTIEPQSLPPPFTIEVNKDVYHTDDDDIRITVSTKNHEKIIGFMIATKLVNLKLDQSKSYGNLGTNDLPANKICETNSIGNALALTNVSNFEPRESISFFWKSLRSTKGHLQFKVSLIFSNDRFWVAEPSKMILDEKSPPPPDVPSPTPPPSHDSIVISQCGKERGCYRNPPGCDPLDCDALVTWMEHRDGVDFQMTGDTTGWVSVAFSKDTKLGGGDEVFECLWNDTSKQVEIKHLRMKDDGKSSYPVSNPLSLSNKIGVHHNRRITCFFRKEKSSQFASEPIYLLLSKGRADKLGRKVIHAQEANKYPYVSPYVVMASDRVDMSDTIRYPLVKAHGCLMVLAWMVCFMTAMMLNKYYRPMWPNTRWCDSRVWYSAYMFLVALCVVFTVVGFILIFVHASGYVELNIYPDKAHPPIGICTTILIILVFLLAFCRPTEPNKRTSFGVCINWFLWLFETAACVLATVNIFIGLSLPKAHVPWWTTWIVAAFFLFHLIVELTLEIHGCLNSKKEDFRRQEFEKQKKGSQEPDPVGRGFKNRTLAIYLVVSLVLCFIIIIGIASG